YSMFINMNEYVWGQGVVTAGLTLSISLAFVHFVRKMDGLGQPVCFTLAGDNFEIRQGLSGKERRMQGQISQLIDISVIEPFEKNSGDLVLYTGGGNRFRLTKGANRLENLALISDIIQVIEKQQLPLTPAFNQALAGWKVKLAELEDESCWKGTPVSRFMVQKTHDRTLIEIPAHDLTGWLVCLFWLGMGMSFWGLTHLLKLISDVLSARNFIEYFQAFHPTSSLFKQPGT
ncbi:MAG: hypothetical protein ACAI44_27230, partial [Candidatus Sericytochromatia bacterium]